MSVDVIRSAALGDVPHGFLGRRGGVSEGIFASLNVGLGSSDDPAAVSENRARAVEAVAPRATLTTLYQIHSAQVVTVDAPLTERPQADALVTCTPGLLLGILTADCAPVLFADVQAGVIGAAHAGWKGALGGVTDATIAAMEALGAHRSQIVAAIGPCIARKSYEVSDAFVETFATADPANERFFSGGTVGHVYFDLEGYVAHRLHAAGLSRVDALGLDTLSDNERFFSYRRTTLAREPDYGRQISLIGL
jgi:YfiH family protein